MPGEQSLPEGFYEELYTRALRDRIEQSPLEARFSELTELEMADRLADHVERTLRRRLQTEKPTRHVDLVNTLMHDLDAPEQSLAAEPRILTALLREPGPGNPPRYTRRPLTSLAEANLMTNASDEPSLAAELKSELASADVVLLLSAFIKWSGLRTMTDALKEAADKGIPIRVITTTYMGATEAGALDHLCRDFGAQVRISYETRRTRLHAKAWLFKRNTGFHTAYVGSSNLSAPALLDGLEWNVRLASHATPQLLRKFEATFTQYWNDPSFESYDPTVDRDRLEEALAVTGGRRASAGEIISVSGLQVRPFPYQQEMLESLDVQRNVHDRHRNLIVAATGTGKTVVAALDYRYLCERWQQKGSRPSLLFIAHRKEILQQALRTFREVLADGAFGELWGDGQRPNDWQHVFASIQSLNRTDIDSIRPSAFDVVIVDEFHHSAAPSYRRLLQHLTPRELIGLTATPERADGLDVLSYFDGHITAELRLWEALEAELLSPFHYFLISDATDLSQLSWKRGTYDPGELDKLYTGNERRAQLILESVRDLIADPLGMRALGFCVGVSHARWMAHVFNKAGIPSVAVAGDTSAVDRASALQHLREGTISVIFAVDMFNEGVDVPDIDTVLFLRPTESATIFLQQLGRGLRRTKDKAVLTALDFVGHQHEDFRFDTKLQALTGVPRRALEGQITEDFPYLPSGCQIVMDRVAQEQVLRSLKRQLSSNWKSLTADLRAVGDVDLATFLEETNTPLSAVISGQNHSWTQLRRTAGFSTQGGGSRETELLKRGRSLAHVDDALRGDAYLRLLADDVPPYEDLSPLDQRFWRMLYFSIWPKGEAGSFANGLLSLREEVAFRREVSELIALGLEKADHRPRPLLGHLAQTGLQSHAHYKREELLTALDYATLTRSPGNFREGAFYADSFQTDGLLVTLNKDAERTSPTTMYKDFAISPDLFHWESQSSTTQASPTGQRYLTQRSSGGNILLFTRAEAKNELGKGAPYLLLGEADHISHEGEKPIAITWKLRRPMPADVFSMAKVAAG